MIMDCPWVNRYFIVSYINVIASKYNELSYYTHRRMDASKHGLGAAAVHAETSLQVGARIWFSRLIVEEFLINDFFVYLKEHGNDCL